MADSNKFDLSPPEAEQPEMTEAGKMAMRQAMTNPLLLNKILHSMDFIQDLKSTRQVSHLWNIFGSQILLKNPLVDVALEFDSKSGQFYWTNYLTSLFITENCRDYESLYRRPKINIFSRSDAPRYSLKTLNEILKNSSNFPCQSFTFIGGDLGQQEVRELFQLQGPSIKSLQLDNISRKYSAHDFTGNSIDYMEYTSGSTIQEIFGSLVNLEELTLKNTQFDWPENDDQKLTLSKLKYLEFDQAQELVHKIIQNSPNLQTIKVHSVNDLTCIMSPTISRVDTIKEVTCHFLTPSRVIENLARNVPKYLRKISIKSLQHPFSNDDTTDLCSSVPYLLRACANSLETLHLGNLIGLSELERLPRFSKLKTLKLGPYGYRHKLCLPPRTILKETFPNVRTLDCTLLNIGEDTSWDMHFPPPDAYFGHFDQVKELKMWDNCRDLWLINFKELCLNFNKIVMAGSWQLEKGLSAVFKLWNHLKEITLLVTFAAVEAGDLDSILTGLSRGRCQDLRLAMEEEGEGSIDWKEEDKVFSSIVDLTELERLNIVFLDPFPQDHQTFTLISWIYAFQLMPKLKVKVEYDHTRFLGYSNFDSIRPFVNILHRRSHTTAEEFDM